MSSDQQYPYQGAHGGGHRNGPQGGPDRDVSQTWEGQTWDTHYQPAVPSAPDGGVYLPPQQTGPAPAAYDAPTACLPPVADPAPPGPGVPRGTAGRAPPATAPRRTPPSRPRPRRDSGYASAPYPQDQAAPGSRAAGHGSAPYPAGAAQAGYGSAPYAPEAGRPVTRPPRTPPPGTGRSGSGGGAPGGTSLPRTGSTGARAGRGRGARRRGGARVRRSHHPRRHPHHGRPAGPRRRTLADHRWDPAAGLTALLGVLLAAGAAVGPYGLLVPVLLLQAVTAAGWFRLNGMWPARQGIALAFLGGVVADAVLLAAGREHAPAAILGTLGVWVLLVLVLQLRSHAAPEERMYGLMATVASSALAVVGAGFLAAGPDAAVVAALAVAAAAVARALPLPGPASLAAGLLAAAGAGLAPPVRRPGRARAPRPRDWALRRESARWSACGSPATTTRPGSCT